MILFGITFWRWRKIASAPHDRSVYLAKPTRSVPVRARWRIGPKGRPCWMSDDDGRELKGATHWAPVPDLPRFK